jgi:nitrite reductase/ring-hydroxylating ferredoxin subunit
VKSAYGLKIPEPDPELTRVGPGAPCGELMRRYWQPVCLSADLADLPKKVRILGEDLIAFRDGQGRAGLLFFRCSLRGTSLEFGRVEDRGLRCCYHGWLYDVEGNVIEMPLEPAVNPFLKQIQHPAYPVREFGGLVFAYMGPLEKIPEFPMGMRFVLVRRLETGKWWELIWEMLMPLNIHLVYTDEPRTERVRAVTYCMPVDDTHQLGASIRWLPDDGEDQTRGREQLAPGGRKNSSYEHTQRHPDDKEAVEGQGPIALHGLEHLVTSDKGVIMFRRILRTAIDAVRAGQDPKGILRDGVKAANVATSAGSVLRD